MAAKKRRERACSVGYRSPPKETQFKPGKSGNPKGRPKGIRPVGAILQEIIGRKVSVTENGKTRRLNEIKELLSSMKLHLGTVVQGWPPQAVSIT